MIYLPTFTNCVCLVYSVVNNILKIKLTIVRIQIVMHQMFKIVRIITYRYKNL